MNDSEEKMKLLKISPEQAAKIMGEPTQFVRCGLQHGILPFGTAIKYREDSKRFKYYINPYQFFKYLGRQDLLEQWLNQIQGTSYKLERG